jgi:peptidyl-prolyl cis-trans isomerase D
VLQQMRSARFVIIVWTVVAAAFVGGFLVAQTSGLLGRTPLTPTTAVAVVNGNEILYTNYVQRTQADVQNAQQREGRTLTQDEVRRIEDQTFDQMVTEILLQDEYRRRGIVVTDDELREYARYAPPPWVQQAPELQTDGRFDVVKYQRMLASPAARQQGFLAGLEQYYRTEIPREKLLDEITAGAYVTDVELWRVWQDAHDSAQASFVAFRPAPDMAVLKAIPDNEARAYFDKHRALFERPGRAMLSVVILPRPITAADTAAAKARAVALRTEITSGKSKFEDVAKRESADTAS